MIRLSLRGIDKVQVRVSRIQRNLADLGPPLLKSAIILRDSAVTRFKDEGPGWAPTRRGGHIGIDTGRLSQSMGISQPVRQADATSITVGTGVYYAKYFQYGTGIYAGHSAWTVRNSFGVKGWVTHHLGQPPRPFLFISQVDRDKIRKIFKKHMNDSS